MLLVHGSKRFAERDVEVAEDTKEKGRKVPPPVISAPPGKDYERRLQEDPADSDTKVDVGSDESMDASDPPSAAQPGRDDDPVPSSGFPDR